MRRGFKAWCERTSTEYRQILGILLTEPLEPRVLAEYVGVRLAVPQDIPGLSRSSLKQLTVDGADSWSAVTLTHEGVVLIIVNSGQSPRRQANSVCHELAHVILNHKPDDTQVSQQGFLFRARFNAEQEEEADWLAGCLLVPAEGLIQTYRRSRSIPLLADHFGVSQDLITWRVRMTGARKRVLPRA